MSGALCESKETWRGKVGKTDTADRQTASTGPRPRSTTRKNQEPKTEAAWFSHGDSPGQRAGPTSLLEVFPPHLPPRINLRSKIRGSEHPHLHHQIVLQLNKLAHLPTCQASAGYQAAGHICSGTHRLRRLGHITSLNFNFLIHNTRLNHEGFIKYQIKSSQENISPCYTICQHDS